MILIKMDDLSSPTPLIIQNETSTTIKALFLPITLLTCSIWTLFKYVSAACLRLTSYFLFPEQAEIAVHIIYSHSLY